MLSVSDHSRDSAGLRYVYPVVSRRAGGVSVGINLNTNNACNWACAYCQVPNLTRGGPPPVDLLVLGSELRFFLERATSGDFLARNAPPEARRLVDVAFSGNGEPTSASEFPDAVHVVNTVLSEFSLRDKIKLRLITNGSLLHKLSVREGIAALGMGNGEVWFKVDRASEEGIATINGVRLKPTRIRRDLLVCAGLAPTWVQTCYFATDGMAPSESEQQAYLEFIKSVRAKIKGVLLYGLARPSLQPDAERLSNVTPDRFEDFAQRVESLGVEVLRNP